MNRILIAGAAGFIGSNLAMHYLAEGDLVLGLDNFATGKHSNLEALIQHENFKFETCDVSEEIPHDFRDVDYVFHLASPASPPKYMELPIETMLVNSLGTKNLLDLSMRSGARFLFASTSESYGDPSVSPQSEDYWGNVNPIGPRSVYDEAKRFGEAMVAAYQRTFDADAVIVRLFNTYGPLMDPYDGRVVSNFIRQALSGQPLTVYGDGLQTRSFCYVDDTISGLVAAIESKHPGPINLGNPREMSLIELANAVGEALELPLEVNFSDLPVDDPKQRQPDISLAQKELGWAPRVSLEDGLRATADWMRKEIGH